MIEALNYLLDIIMRDPVIVVLGIILLISYYADAIDRW
jgi:hypothetical protein